MQLAENIIRTIANKTDKVILFHSASGKDSIALLNLLYPHFEEIICVFMYIVKDLSHINRYLNYAKTKYPKIRFIQIPHPALFSYIKNGYKGCEQNSGQRLYTLAQLTEDIREKTGIEWVMCGFKQSGGMNRRLMLRSYKMDAICEKTKKCYPLSSYKNKEVLKYISDNDLIKPESYGKCQSSGTSIDDLNYLIFLRDNFPSDLKKVIEQYPLVERTLFEHDYKRAKTE